MTEGNYKLNLRSDWDDRSNRISTHSFMMSLFKTVDILINAMIFATAWSIQSEFGTFGGTTLVLLFIFALLTYILFKTYNGFQVGLRTVEDLVFSQSLALLFSNLGIFFVQVLLLKGLPNLWVALVTLIVNIAWSVIWCLLANRLYNRLFPALKTAIVYEYREALESIEGLYRQEKRFNVIRTIHVSENVNEILPQLMDVEAVFLCGMPAHKRNVILKHCVEQGVRAYVRPNIGDVILSSAEKMQMFHVPMLMCRRRTMPLSYRAAKRIIDVVLAGIAFLVASPFMLITAIAIKMHDQGPVLYKQKRITRNGKIFEIIKFRSMKVDAEKDGRARLAAEGDDRITPVGKVIRKIRFDELPQLLNILKGEMSIVGPRPERPEIAEQYAAMLPEFDLRLQIKAGLTGFAQVHGRYNTSPYDKLQMDLMYVANQSLLQDLKIIFQTVKVVLMFGESTQGVAAEGEVGCERESA